MSGLLKNKNLVVMGVANKWSIAWGIAKKFIEHDGNVIFTYLGEKTKNSIEKLLAAENYSNALLVECDVTNDEEIKKTFDLIAKSYPVIHSVVHSIAHAKKEELRGNYYDTSRDGFLMAQNISAFSLVKVTKYAKDIMSEGGAIVTMTYLGGERVVKNYNVMGVAKASLESSVKYLAHDLGQAGIRVNAISAGPIKTLAAKGVGDFNDIASVFLSKAPIRKLVTHEQLGNAALFLCSDMGTGVTGEVLHVDNGFNILGY
ncbi:enoyl-ACP reductase FabI [Helicovermis profundi]|uniref:Enoyl-[acyl-carrier-protein] reductase [NADH] n=1 Tax=Helicovermis profundi TaxID=3065157 RepID=A0AAU9ER32_9FIRM|nr:enoyl-ACP reductase FabI [Clostridia bacterium S502]